jgi:hypothetical protein
MTAMTNGATPHDATLSDLMRQALTQVGSAVLDAVRAPLSSLSTTTRKPLDTAQPASSQMLPASSKTMKKPWVISQARDLGAAASVQPSMGT